VPKRFCQCQGCPACGQHPGNHGTLFDVDATRTMRCPPCQAHATATRQQRANTTARGYGSAHQKTKAELLEQWQPGDPCAHCQQPMTEADRYSRDGLDLAHTGDRSGYRGLAHAACNRGNR
jgi:hypothetical protein